MTAPFTLDTRVSVALEARPSLRERLPGFHPAFEKLKHPVLGRVMPRLVNIRDAARVAGVDADALLALMNLPDAPGTGGEAPALPAAPRADEPAPAWRRGATVELLDLHPALARGEEPFSLVLKALRALGPGRVLELRTPFEPAPLRSFLGERGWESHAAWTGEVCATSFFRRPDAGLPAELDAEAAPDWRARLRAGDGPPELDLRGLEPPQPMRAALAALDALGPPLRLRHHREPALLYPRLEARGLRWTVVQDGDEHLITIEAAAPSGGGVAG